MAVDKWLLQTDPNGQKYGKWLRNSTKKGVGWGECIICRVEINIEPGKPNIVQHAKTAKHRKYQHEATTANILNSSQPTIHQALVRQDEISQPTKKAKLLEIMLLQSFSRHNIPPAYLDCLVSLLKELTLT